MNPPNGQAWTPEQVTLLTQHYSGGNCAAMIELFGRKMDAIRAKAHRLGLEWPRFQPDHARSGDADPCVTALRLERLRQGKSLDDVARNAGYARSAISRWELGHAQPSVHALRDWASALGFTLGFLERGK